MSLELGRFKKIKTVIQETLRPNLEVGRVYGLKDPSTGNHQVIILEVYNDSILTIPGDLKGKVRYAELGQGGKIVREIISTEKDFEKIYIKLPKDIDVTDYKKSVGLYNM